MKVIPETRREHEIGYLHFHICISRILHLKEAGQIGPKPNRPKVKSAPSQIGPSQIGPKSNRPKSNRPHFCCLLLSTCKVK